MKFKIKKPVTNSQRHLIQLSREELSKKPFIKHKLHTLKRFSGRNNCGQVTVRHQGGGHKKRFREINFDRKDLSTGIVCTIEYDPNRTANIASVYDILNDNFFYILAPKNTKIGDIIQSGTGSQSKLGHSLPISEIPVGSYIHNVSPKTYKYAQFSRAAGTFSKLKEKTLDSAKIELSSGEQRFMSPKCYATMGIVSNEFIYLTKLGKAGRARWLNVRPSVRGVAMNPIDHPHGGGEGKKSGKGKTPWGKTLKKIR